MHRYEAAKKKRREPNQKTLESYGLKTNKAKRFKRSHPISKSCLEPSIRKLLTTEVVKSQLEIINTDLQPPNLQNKASFIDFGQLCMDIGYQLKRNLDMKELMLCGKQLTERNKVEFDLL